MTDELTLERCNEGTVLYSGYGQSDFTITGAPIFTTLKNLPIRRCPQCGSTDADGEVYFYGKAMGNIAGYYCAVCYGHWVAQHVPKMEAL